MNVFQKAWKKTLEVLGNIRSFFLYAILGILALVLIYVAAYFWSYQTIEVTITEKERVTINSDEGVESNYRVYTTEEVFVNKDQLIFGKFDSSDVQRKLLDGNTYKVKVVGWRVPLFSWYRNIISVVE